MLVKYKYIPKSCGFDFLYTLKTMLVKYKSLMEQR